MKITYSSISGLFRAPRNWEKVRKLTNDDLLIPEYENSAQEDVNQHTVPPPGFKDKYNMRDNVTISLTNAPAV